MATTKKKVSRSNKLQSNSKLKGVGKTLEIKGDLVELSALPPQLRKLAKHILKNGVEVSLRQTCDDLKMNYNSVTSQIHTLKQKGIDLQAFLEEVSASYLETELINVDKALVKGALKGSHNHQKLYYQRTNKINQDTNVNINILSVGVAHSSRPKDLERKKGIIDLEPVIPTDDVFNDD